MIPPPPRIAPSTPTFRRRRKPRPAPSAPAALNQITGVAYGPAVDTLVVTVSGTLLSVADLVGAMRLEVDENSYDPIDASLDDLPQVTLTYERDVTTATAWTIPDPAAWQFAAGNLAAPFSGSID